jgi:hypothetical protein
MAVRRPTLSFRHRPGPEPPSDPFDEGATGSKETSPDLGQATPLLVAALALVVVVALGVVRIATVVGDRARAHTAADAAALAGAIEGRPAAADIAAANGGILVTFEHAGGQVEVRVRVGDAEATSRAELRR